VLQGRRFKLVFLLRRVLVGESLKIETANAHGYADPEIEGRRDEGEMAKAMGIAGRELDAIWELLWR
jgi:hypothetical protein